MGIAALSLALYSTMGMHDAATLIRYMGLIEAYDNHVSVNYFWACS